MLLWLIRLGGVGSEKDKIRKSRIVLSGDYGDIIGSFLFGRIFF